MMVMLLLLLLLLLLMMMIHSRNSSGGGSSRRPSGDGVSRRIDIRMAMGQLLQRRQRLLHLHARGGGLRLGARLDRFHEHIDFRGKVDFVGGFVLRGACCCGCSGSGSVIGCCC